MKRLLSFVLWGFLLPCFAQQQTNYAFPLPGGVLVLYQVYSEITLGGEDRTVSKAEAKGDRIRRVLWNREGMPWLGFDVRVKKLEAGRIRLSVEPVPGVRFFARKPVDREVAPGDRVLLDVLESPDTGKRVFDTFVVGFEGTPMQIMPMPRSIPGMAPAGTTIRVVAPKLERDGGEMASAQVNGGIRATEAGREFLFSASPDAGYRMEAIAEGNQIRFLDGNASYTLTSREPVVKHPGAWYLWLRSGAIPGEGFR